jgi:2-keto-4-pentenoate hydratase
MDRVASASEHLLELRRKQTPVAALPPDLAPRNLAEGYEVQVRLVQALLDRSGGTPIGYKVACTSALAQKALGVDGPFFGVLMSQSTHASPARLPAAAFTVRCIEAEFAFEIAADVPAGAAHTADSITAYIGAALPSIEIVDHRYHDWKAVGAPSLLADNAIHGAWIFGEPSADWRDIDFAKHPVTLTVNEDRLFPGSGAAVLGNPLNVMAWLANELPRFGRRLRRGDRVTTGLTTDVYLASPGDRFIADFGPLGKVALAFE